MTNCIKGPQTIITITIIKTHQGPETDTTAAVVAQSATTEAFAPAAGQCRLCFDFVLCVSFIFINVQCSTNVHIDQWFHPPGMITSQSAAQALLLSQLYVELCR